MLAGFGHIRYEISAQDFELNLELDAPLETLDLPVSNDAWTQLDLHQCQQCKLASTTACPVAANLNQHIDAFAHLASYDMTHVTVILDDKIRVATELPAQQLLASIIGIIIAKSKACPSTAILQPMVVFHRPFASQEESIYRSIANAALVHTLRKHRNESFAQFTFQQYQGLHQVNISLVKRLQEHHPDWEAVINAIVNLDLFVKEILYNVKSDFPDLDYLSDVAL